GAVSTPDARRALGAFLRAHRERLPPSAGAAGRRRTPGLRRDSDGSLTIVIQHEQPADTSNWLTAPAAPFRPLMRLYQPQAAVLDGTYKIPPITKATS
ncbi:MAG TPA: hypothetical protein DEH11_21950, partial [Actinobacteria bacterium]|nr:hypothetical protein [Actinomycetota bacterium]